MAEGNGRMSGENNEDVAYDAAVKTAEQIEAKQQHSNGKVDNLCTLESGVVIRVKPVNPLLIEGAGRNVPEPEVPMSYLKDEEKYIPNYDNPQYIKAVAQWRYDQQMAVIDTGYLMGTEIVSVPDGIDKPEDDTWMEHLVFLGIIDPVQVQSSRFARYLAWLKYYAITSDEDFPKLTNAVMRTAGVQEGDVQDAVATFPNRKARRANSKSRTPSHDKNGNNLRIVD